MSIIEKNFPAFRVAFLAYRPQGLTTKLFLSKNGVDIPVYGARAQDNEMWVITTNRELVFVAEADILYIQEN